MGVVAGQVGVRKVVRYSRATTAACYDVSETGAAATVRQHCGKRCLGTVVMLVVVVDGRARGRDAESCSGVKSYACEAGTAAVA